MPRRTVHVTFNALRRYLYAGGCTEVRQLGLVRDEPKATRIYIGIECVTRSGRLCRVSFSYERTGATEVRPDLLARLEKTLAPCLGRDWTRQIDESPFN